ncbi:hypothetical protein FB451DRAFT_1186679 [Mycena latifolia]|nr:hypothetical protein FB451DRAFT_1186679 [Mycena latifolia]
MGLLLLFCHLDFRGLSLSLSSSSCTCAVKLASFFSARVFWRLASRRSSHGEYIGLEDNIEGTPGTGVDETTVNGDAQSKGARIGVATPNSSSASSSDSVTADKGDECPTRGKDLTEWAHVGEGTHEPVVNCPPWQRERPPCRPQQLPAIQPLLLAAHTRGSKDKNCPYGGPNHPDHIRLPLESIWEARTTTVGNVTAVLELQNGKKEVHEGLEGHLPQIPVPKKDGFPREVGDIIFSYLWTPLGTQHKVKPKKDIPSGSKRTPTQLEAIRKELKLLPDLIKKHYTKWGPKGATVTEFQLECMGGQALGQDILVHAATGAGKTGIAAGPHLLPSSKVGRWTLYKSGTSHQILEKPVPEWSRCVKKPVDHVVEVYARIIASSSHPLFLIPPALCCRSIWSFEAYLEELPPSGIQRMNFDHLDYAVPEVIILDGQSHYILLTLFGHRKRLDKSITGRIKPNSQMLNILINILQFYVVFYCTTDQEGEKDLHSALIKAGCYPETFHLASPPPHPKNKILFTLRHYHRVTFA